MKPLWTPTPVIDRRPKRGLHVGYGLMRDGQMLTQEDGRYWITRYFWWAEARARRLNRVILKQKAGV